MKKSIVKAQEIVFIGLSDHFGGFESDRLKKVQTHRIEQILNRTFILKCLKENFYRTVDAIENHLPNL